MKYIWAPHTSIYQLWKANETTKKKTHYGQSGKFIFGMELLSTHYYTPHCFILLL